jgi:hypothetical protein
VFGCGEQFREVDQRGDALGALLPQEGSAFLFRKAQSALTGLIVHQQQEGDFLKRAQHPALALRAPAFHAAHKRPAPTVGRGVADGAEHGRVCRRVKRAGTNLQGWLQRESCGIFQPCLVVFEGGAFLVLARTGPQTPHQVRDAVEIHGIREPLCPSLVFRAFRAALHANALRQVFFFELQAHGIVLRRGEIAKPVRHAQHKKDRGVYPDRDAGFALFNLDEGRAADRGALRRDGRRDASPPPGVTDVVAELTQGMSYRERHYDG